MIFSEARGMEMEKERRARARFLVFASCDK
jgi:hypothetical protein